MELLIQLYLIKNTNATDSIKECEWYGFNNHEIQSYEYSEIQNLLKDWNKSLQDYVDFELELSSKYDFISPSSSFQEEPEVIIEINEIRSTLPSAYSVDMYII